MRVLMVHAHPEPKSFNGAMTRAAFEALVAAGHAVEVSDLYAMRFSPVYRFSAPEVTMSPQLRLNRKPAPRAAPTPTGK